jgi:type VI secretion system VasI/ImpG family protein
VDFLDYYRDNLLYIRGLAAEFAGEFPKIAGRLSISEFECQDPYVERLLEGTAFLSARVEKKLDEGYERLLESVLNSMAPSALYPIPSGAVLELALDYNSEKVRKGGVLEKGTVFDAFIPTINTPCRFSTLMDLSLSPLSLIGAEYVTRDLSGFGINDEKAQAALHISLSSGEAMNQNGDTTFFFNLPDDGASLLLRQIMIGRLGVYVRYNNEKYVPLNNISFEMPFNADTRTLYQGLKGNVRGLRLLQDFMAYPSFFKFFKIKNLPLRFSGRSSVLELVITFRQRELSLAAEIKHSSIKLNCAPVLNLFPKRSDRMPLEREAYEYHIVPERAAMRDFEVINIRSLEFFNERNETLFRAANFYEDDLLQGGVERNFFSQHRRRNLFTTKAVQRSSYDGAEMYVTFSSQEHSLEDAYQFAAEMTCTNRDLPLLLSSDAALITNSPVLTGASFLTRPTRPGYSNIERGDKADFTKLSHILYNLSAMLWQAGDFPLEMFKTMLRNYRIRTDEETFRMADGIVKMESSPATFRFVQKGAVFFERGWKLNITLDESAYAGIGHYIFAFVIAEILRSFTPINSMLEVNVYTLQTGYITTWKTALEN